MSRHWPTTILGILLTVALIVLGLYGFANAPLLAAARGASRPDLITMAIRAGAVAVIAAGQVVLLFTIWRVSGPRAFDWALAIGLLLLTGVAIACAVALARTGR